MNIKVKSFYITGETFNIQSDQFKNRLKYLI